MSKLLKFFLLLVAVSLPLFFIWYNGGLKYYSLLIQKSSLPFAKLLQEPKLGIKVAQANYIDLIPFVALMAAVPGLRLKRKLALLAFGLVLLYFWHIALTLILNHFQIQWSDSPKFYRLYVPLSRSLATAVPLILWFLLAWKGAKELLGEIFVRPAPRAPLKTS